MTHSESRNTNHQYNRRKLKRSHLTNGDVGRISSVPRRSQRKYTPDYSVIENYASYSYIRYHRLLCDGFIRQNSNNLLLFIPPEINDIFHANFYIRQDGAFQLAHFVCSMVMDTKLNITKADGAGLIRIGFSGDQLIVYLLKNIAAFNEVSKEELFAYCNELLHYQYIKAIATTFTNKHNMNAMFCHSTQYIVNPQRMNHISLYTKFLRVYDRFAWNVNSLVEIKSVSGGWKKGKIVQVDDNKAADCAEVTVIYQSDLDKILKRTAKLVRGIKLNRYDIDNIRSTAEFIESRKRWNEGSVIEIYSESKRRWFKGHVTDISIPHEDKSYIEYVDVAYYHKDKRYTKSVPRWSCLVRD